MFFSSLLVLTAMWIIASNDLATIESDLEQQADTLNRAFAENFAMVIALEDVQTQANLVNKLKQFNELLTLSITSQENNKPVFNYRSSTDSGPHDATFTLPVKYMGGEYGQVTISLSGQKLVAAKNQYYDYLLKIFLLTAMLSLFVGLIIEKVVDAPINRLIQFVSTTNNTGDYSRQISHRESGALGKLYTDINQMIAAIHSKQEQLIAHQNQLEQTIAERTKVLRGEIQQHQQTMSELEQARIDAESANRAKSEFLSNMSHELRTPLNAILGFAQIIQLDDQHLSEQDREHVDYIANAGRHLLDLINDILELSKIEAGKLTVTMDEFPLASILAESLQLVEPLASERGIDIGRPSGPITANVISDFRKLKQAVINLLSNAIKYNKENGSISISCEVIDNNLLRLSITDTGKGIPIERQNELFKPFSRLDAEDTLTGGTGIGLVLTRYLIEEMNGYIGLNSEEGKGSTFWLDIPLADPDYTDGSYPSFSFPDEDDDTDLTTTTEDTVPDNDNIRILYVEDSTFNVRLIQAVVKKHPRLELIVATTAEEGLDKLRAEKPDIVLMDINLPGMNGYEAIKIIRQEPEIADTPVLALSADAMKDAVHEGEQAGFDRYLTKPVDLSILMQTISEISGI